MNEVAEESYKCPYDPSHSIIKSRIQTHLVRCEASHRHLNMVRCPFSPLHVFQRRELKDHIPICDKRPVVNNDEVSDVSLQVPSVTPPLEPPQDWDKEPPAPSYLDSLQEGNPAPVQCLMLASKSQKKKFRQAQRRKELDRVRE